MMNETEARVYRAAYDSAVKRYSTMTRAALAAEERAIMADQGTQRLWGGLGSRDELIISILNLRGYTIDKWNESTHVIAHQVPWPDCPHCQHEEAVRRNTMNTFGVA